MNVEVIKKQKEMLGLTNEVIAEEVGITVATFYRWLNGSIRKVPKDKLEKLAKVLVLSPSSLMEDTQHLVKPILGSVKAGYDFYIEEDILGYEEVSERDAQKGDYYLQVTGDSMVGDRIFDGDLVFVKQVHNVDDDEIAVVVIGEEVTVKKVVKKDDILVLEASNPNYGNRYFNQSEIENLPVKIIGKVLHSKRNFT